MSQLQSLPPQRLPDSKKNTEWKRNCVDAIAAITVHFDDDERTSRERKLTNYNLMNSILDEKDFQYTINPYNIQDATSWSSPAKLRTYNLIRDKVNVLLGEELQRGFNYEVVATGGNAINEKTEETNQVVKQAIIQQILSKVKPQIDENGQPIEPELPEHVQKRMQTSFKTETEIVMSNLMDYERHRLKLDMMFNKGFYDGLVVSEEIYYVGLKNGYPYVRQVNPVFFDYDKNLDVSNIEDSQWTREDRYLTPAEVIDEFGDFLKNDEIDRIYEGNIQGFNRGNTQLPGFVYDKDRRDYVTKRVDRESVQNIQVTTVTWKSLRKIGFLSYIDEMGQPQEDVVDGSFVLTSEMKEEGFSIEYRWITEPWVGHRIGEDIYVDIKPLEHQVRNNQNISECKLPYVGVVYNDRNAKPHSFVDLIKPHQYLYDIIWYKLELEIQKAKGKKFIMDISQIPASQGIDVDKWMHYFDNVGIAFINPYEEGNNPNNQGPRRTDAAQFNQFQAVDMTLSQSIGQYIGILSKLESMIDDISGITKQREGQVSNRETATGVTTSVIQSSFITEPYFLTHNDLKGRVITQLIEICKFAYKKGDVIQYIADDNDIQYIKVTKDDLSLSDLGVFVRNSSKDNLVKSKLEQLAQVALQTDKAKLSDIIALYNSNSIAKTETVIKEGEREKDLENQRTMQQQQAMQEQQIAAQQESEKLRIENENMNKQLDREKDIQVATIRAMGFQSDSDVDKDGVSDIQEQNKIAIAEMNNATNKELKEMELRLKQEEIKTKAQVEKYKADKNLEIAKENKNKYDK